MCLSNGASSATSSDTMDTSNKASNNNPTSNSTSNGTSSASPPPHIRSSSPCSPIPPHTSGLVFPGGFGGLSRSHLSSPPRGSPPTLVPSAMSSMVSMASMLGHHGPPFLPPGYHRDFAAAAAAAAAGRNDEFAASMHKFMDRSFGDSPPPITAPDGQRMQNSRLPR